MTATFTVIAERLESFMGKRGKVENSILALLDLDPKHPMINTVDYVLSPDEETKYSGKCRGKRIELAIISAMVDFGGRLRLKGEILKVE